MTRTARLTAAFAAASAAVALAAPAAYADAPPRVTITTPSWSVLAGPALPAEGTATDDLGIARVEVTFCGNGSVDVNGGWSCGTGIGGLSVLRTVTADLACDAARRSCTWTAAPPLNPDRYLVFADAYDTAGGSAWDGPVYVLVV